MKLTSPVAYLLLVAVLFSSACKSAKMVQSDSLADDQFIPVSNIALYDKPLDTIKKHVVGPKWQLIHSIGGITGSDRNDFDSTYYTLTKTGRMIIEKKGKVEEAPYTWEETRDIFTGNTIHIISGIVHWKVEGIDNDTLRVADNYVDGYGYAMVRVK